MVEKTVLVEITPEDVIEKFSGASNKEQAKILSEIYQTLHVLCGSVGAYHYQIESIAEELDDCAKNLIMNLAEHLDVKWKYTQ